MIYFYVVVRGVSGTGTESRVPGTRAGPESQVLRGRDRVHIYGHKNVEKMLFCSFFSKIPSTPDKTVCYIPTKLIERDYLKCTVMSEQ